MTQRNWFLKSIANAIFVMVILLCNQGFCENSMSLNKNSLEILVPGLFANSYHETIRTGVVPTGPHRDFEIDGRYSRHIHRYIGLGISAHSRKYDKGHFEAGNLSAIFINDFSTSVFGLGGFVQTMYGKGRIFPYVAFGAGYRRIKIRDDSTTIDRFRPDNVFHSSTESTMDKFGIALFGGLRIAISNQFYGAIEADYFTAQSTMRSFGLNAGLGVSW